MYSSDGIQTQKIGLGALDPIYKLKVSCIFKAVWENCVLLDQIKTKNNAKQAASLQSSDIQDLPEKMAMFIRLYYALPSKILHSKKCPVSTR